MANQQNTQPQNQIQLFTPSFVGRDTETNSILKYLAEFKDGKGNGIVLLEGENFVGKKEIVKNFVKKARGAGNSFYYSKAQFLNPQVVQRESNISETYKKINPSQKGSNHLQRLHNLFINDFERLAKSNPPRHETLYSIALVVRILAPILDSISNPGEVYEKISGILTEHEKTEPYSKTFEVFKEVLFHAAKTKSVILALLDTEHIPLIWKRFLWEQFLPQVQAEKKNIFFVLTNSFISVIETEASVETEAKFDKIKIGNLSKEETVSLVEKNIQENSDLPELAGIVFEISAGNPGVIKMALDRLVLTKQLEKTQFSWKLESDWKSSIEQFTPKVIEKVIFEATEHEMANSNVTFETLNKWLRFAAFMGGNFSANLVAKAFDLSEDFVIDFLDDVLVYDQEAKKGFFKEAGWINLKYKPHPNYQFVDFLYWSHFRSQISKEEVVEFAKLFATTLDENFYVDKEFFSSVLDKLYRILGDTENEKKFIEINKSRTQHYVLADALNYYRACANILKSGTYKAEIFEYLTLISKQLASPQNVKDNLPTINQLIAQAEEISEGMSKEKLIDLNLSKAVYAVQDSDFGKAEEGLNKIEELGTDKKSVLASVANLRGVIASNQQETEKAIEGFQKSFDIFKEINDLNGSAAALNSMGAVLMNEKKVEEGITKFQEGIKILKEIREIGGTAQSLQNLGSIFLHINQPEKALESFNESLELLKELQHKPGIANSLMNIGSIYQNGGNPEQAQEYFTKAIEILKEVKDVNGTVKALNSLGTSYSGAKEFTKALKVFQEILALCKEANNTHGVALTLNSIGTNYLNEAKYDKAANYFYQAVSKFEEINDKQGLASVHNNLGNLHSKIEGKEKDAIRSYQKAGEFLKELQMKPALGYTLYNMGNVYIRQKDLERAMNCLNESLQIHNETRDGQGIGMTLGQIGNIFRAQNNTKAAIANLVSSFQILQKIGSPAAETSRKSLDDIANELGKVEFEKMIQEIQQEAEVAAQAQKNA